MSSLYPKLDDLESDQMVFQSEPVRVTEPNRSQTIQSVQSEPGIGLRDINLTPKNLFFELFPSSSYKTKVRRSILLKLAQVRVTSVLKTQVRSKFNLCQW